MARRVGLLHHHKLHIVLGTTSCWRSGSLSLAVRIPLRQRQCRRCRRLHLGVYSFLFSLKEVAQHNVLNPHRTCHGVRRNHPAPMPALCAPPPTAPLHALPLVRIPEPQRLRSSNLNLTTLSMANTSAVGAGAASPSAGPL